LKTGKLVKSEIFSKIGLTITGDRSGKNRKTLKTINK
jgi:hypothetical protein